MNTSSLRRCRCGKLRYESKGEAEKALLEVRAKRNRRNDTKKESRIYTCDVAGYYHLSSVPCRDFSKRMKRVEKIVPAVSSDIYFAHFYMGDYETKRGVLTLLLVEANKCCSDAKNHSKPDCINYSLKLE